MYLNKFSDWFRGFSKGLSKINQLDGNLLISSISRKIPLYESINETWGKSKKNKVIVGDIDPNCLASYLIKNFWLMPATSTANSVEIMEYCIENNIKVILPTRNGELKYWADIKDKLQSHGVKTLVSNLATLDICLDKFKFYEFGIENGFRVIPTYLNGTDIDTKKLVVKERFGSGSKGVGLGLDKNGGDVFSKTLEFPIYQPLIEGTEVSVDVWIGESGIGIANVRERNLVIHGESQVTTLIDSPKISALCIEFAKSLGIFGFCVFQAKVVDNDEIFIIECNPRIGGASTISIRHNMDLRNLLCYPNNAENKYLQTANKKILRQIRIPRDLIFYDTDF